VRAIYYSRSDYNNMFFPFTGDNARQRVIFSLAVFHARLILITPIVFYHTAVVFEYKFSSDFCDNNFWVKKLLATTTTQRSICSLPLDFVFYVFLRVLSSRLLNTLFRFTVAIAHYSKLRTNLSPFARIPFK